MEKKQYTIETKRLMLRGIQASDAETIVRWRSAPEVYRYLKSPHAISLEEHLNWFYGNYLLSENRWDWMCVDRKSGNVLGVFGLVREGKNAKVNYLLAPEAQHRGYATEAIRGMLLFASEKWEIRQAIAEIHYANAASVALAQRLGFRLQRLKDDFLIYGTEV